MSQSPQWSAEPPARARAGAGDFGGPRAAGRGTADQADSVQGGRGGETERGLPGILALALLLVIAGIGGLIDQLGGSSIKGGFAIGLVLASFVAIISVRRSGMFPIVIAPPLVYFIASAVLLYIRSGGLSNRKVLIDYASQWLVYGFPAIAGATAIVLVIAGIRITLRR